MAWCRYDNPATMRREIWEDGRMLGFVTYELLATIDYPDTREFVPNTYIGDIEALKRPSGDGGSA